MTEHSNSTSSSQGGLLYSLTAFASTLVAIVHTRLDLLSTDLEEDREYFLLLLGMALAAFFCVGVGVLLAAMLLVVAFWDSHRLLVLGGLAAFFLLSGLAAWWYVVHKWKSKPRLFAASLSELFTDREHLASRL